MVNLLPCGRLTETFHIAGFSSQMVEDATAYHLAQGQAKFASDLRKASDFWTKASLLDRSVRCGWKVN